MYQSHEHSPLVDGSAVALVDALFHPADWVNFRLIESWDEPGRDGGRKRQSRTHENRNVLAADFPGLWPGIAETAATTRANAYYCVCPRPSHLRTRNKAEHTRDVRAVWADLDHCSPAGAVGRFRAAGLPRPTAVVDSGHGVHAYWLLEQLHEIDDHDDTGPADEPTPKTIQIQRVIYGIGQAVGGDAVHDLARLLRLPGTMNRKNERNGVRPVPCRLLALEPELRYPLADLERFAADLPVPAPVTAREPAARDGSDTEGEGGVEGVDYTTARRWRDLSPGQRSRLETSLERVPDDTDRSRSEWSACLFAAKCRLHPDDLFLLMSGVGKVGERGRPYFDSTYSRAWNTARNA